MSTAGDKTSVDPIALRIELDPETKPISGRVMLAGGEIPFAGWLGLAAAMERVIAKPASTKAHRRER